MSTTRQQHSRRTRSGEDAVWVIDLVAAETQRAMQPAAPAAKQRWSLWLGAVAGAVWVWDIGSLLMRVRH
jgi:hypothetical protein